MRNKIILLALLAFMLACGVPVESLTPTGTVPTIKPTETPLPTAQPPTLKPTDPPCPTPGTARVVGNWNVRGEPSSGALSLAVLKDVEVEIIFRADVGWYLIEYDCESLTCYGWVHRDAFGEENE